MIYRDTFIFDPSLLLPERDVPALADIVEFLIGFGSVTQCLTLPGETGKRRITFEIPVESQWEACERAMEVDVHIGSYGCHTDTAASAVKCLDIEWSDTCATALAVMVEGQNARIAQLDAMQRRRR